MRHLNRLRRVFFALAVLLLAACGSGACAGGAEERLTFDEVVQATVESILTPTVAGGRLAFDEAVRATVDAMDELAFDMVVLATVDARRTQMARGSAEGTATPKAILSEEHAYATDVARAVQATVAAMPTPSPVMLEVEKTVLETVIVEKPVQVTVIVSREVIVTSNGSTPQPAVSTSTPAATLIAEPTDTRTPAVSPPATATLQPPRPTATPTRYPAPVLVEPEEGTVFVGREAQVVFRWESVGQLSDEVYYVLNILYPHDGAVWHDEQWTRETSKRVEKYLYDNATLPALMEWYVVVVRRTGTAADGRYQGAELSPRSETRAFSWERPSGGPGPGPATPTVPLRPE